MLSTMQHMQTVSAVKGNLLVQAACLMHQVGWYIQFLLRQVGMPWVEL